MGSSQRAGLFAMKTMRAQYETCNQHGSKRGSSHNGRCHGEEKKRRTDTDFGTPYGRFLIR